MRILFNHLVCRLFSILLLAAAALSFSVTSLAAPKIKCWTNKEGIRECGNSVPPEYAQQGHVEVNERGMVVNKVEARKTKEQLAEEARQKELEEEKKRQALLQANQDRALLSTYSNTDDMEMARDGKIRAVETSIKLAKEKIINLRKQRADLKKSAADMERSGKPVSKQLKSDMEGTMNRINNSKQLIADKQKEREGIKTKYATDIARFKKLRGIK